MRTESFTGNAISILFGKAAGDGARIVGARPRLGSRRPGQNSHSRLVCEVAALADMTITR